MTPSAPIALGLDLGGTRLKSVALDPSGAVLARDVRDSDAARHEDGPLDAMRAAAHALGRASGRTIGGAALGCPGAIDTATGTLGGPTPHLPHWCDFPIARRAADAIGTPVLVENDANCAALAEHRLGAARGAHVSVTLTIGTGLGCGIVVDGRLLRGAHGGAGELGHLPLGSDGARCRCGVAGCAEPLMSGSGLVAAARAAGLDVAGADAVFAAASSGHAAARSLVDRMADRLAATIAIAAHVLDPEVVVLGGGVANAGEPLRAAVESGLDRYIMRSHRSGLRLVLAELGEWAGALGAGLLARDALS